ncbi:MAG: C39 family peptidase [Thermoplasmata archaeon]
MNAALIVVISLAMLAPMIAGNSEAVRGSGLPVSHIIDVPWHQQFNGLFCGAASLEIVFDYWGPDIDQKEIADVARTSSSGTWTYDIVRSGHFSYLSAAQGYFFPNEVPLAGFAERPLGYAAFGYSSDSFWLEDLKALIAADIPVIVLMNYYPTGGGGHYRVVIGYDDAQGLIYFSDPWGRDTNHLTDWTGIIAWTYEDFQSGWNYAEYGLAHPYFGAAIMPWKIDVNVKGQLKVGSTAVISAAVTYPCPAPFDRSQFAAEMTEVDIELPDGLRLVKGASEIAIGTLNAGNTVVLSWTVAVEKPVSGKELMVTASGIVSGWVPEAWWAGGNNYYPPYSYSDAIGNSVSITL